MSFLEHLETLFTWLLTASWQASVLAILILTAQRLLGGRLNPRWRHALWLLVVVRLLLPALPESALSVFQLHRQH
jgi:bla regulator protein BlaR1